MQLGFTVPTAVLQLDLSRVPLVLEVGGQYDAAFVVVRRRLNPVGQFVLRVRDGRVDGELLTRALARLVHARGWYWRIEDYLGPEPVAAALPATVAICTRERPDDLRRALTAVGALRPAPAATLVVDNNPVTARTREVAADFPGVTYVREDRPGLNAARNRALSEAVTPVVAFTDDDAAPEPAWLGHLLQPFADPQVLCTTGLTLPLELETLAQEWFERYTPFGRGFDRKVFDGTKHDPLSVARAGAGANMALRRTLGEQVGMFDEALDAGTPTKSGGDHEMFGRILGAGYRIVYDPRAVSWHRHRRTWPELREAVHGYGVGVYAMWTRRLVRERDPGVVRHAFRWFRFSQLPLFLRALRGRADGVPRDLLLAELRGCVAGPWAYFAARRRLRPRHQGPA